MDTSPADCKLGKALFGRYGRAETVRGIQRTSLIKSLTMSLTFKTQIDSSLNHNLVSVLYLVILGCECWRVHVVMSAVVGVTSWIYTRCCTRIRGVSRGGRSRTEPVQEGPRCPCFAGRVLSWTGPWGLVAWQYSPNVSETLEIYFRVQTVSNINTFSPVCDRDTSNGADGAGLTAL